MIIVNQDATEIINFDNTLNIGVFYDLEIDEATECGYEIYAGMKAPDDNYRILGRYKTEERAKGVLQDIITVYDFREIGNSLMIQNDGFKFQNDMSRVFYMPEE